MVGTPTFTFRRAQPMSALGQKQTYAVHKRMSALPPIATAKAKFSQKSGLLYPRKRTCAVQTAMSALGQKRTLLYTGTVEQEGELRRDQPARWLGPPSKLDSQSRSIYTVEFARPVKQSACCFHCVLSSFGSRQTANVRGELRAASVCVGIAVGTSR